MAELTQVTPRARLLLAPNPGPMTLEGTNTWLLAEPGASRCAVVDPGPDDDGHLRAIAAAAEDCGLTVHVILLTHGHADHSAGAPALSRLCGVRVLASDASYGDALPSELDIDGLQLQVVATPGHSADSVCFAIPADEAVLTGDHVLGRGTSAILYPDGRMGDYLASLERVRALHAQRLLPGHGPVVDDPVTVIDHYVAHREDRLRQLLLALAAGDATPGELVRTLYGESDPHLYDVAELTVRAGLELLIERGVVTRDGEGYEVVSGG